MPRGSKTPMQTSFNRLVCLVFILISMRCLQILSFPATGNAPHRAPLRRGRSLLGREEDVHESGLALFKRGTTRRKRPAPADVDQPPSRRGGCLGHIPGPHDGWVTYCYLLTICVPPFLLRSCGENFRCHLEALELNDYVFRYS